MLLLQVVVFIGINASITDTPDLADVREKLASLEKAVSAAKAKGIDTRYEEVTVTTASQFLDTYIPWDMANPTALAAAFSRWPHQQDLKGTPEQEAARAPKWELQQTSDIVDGALARLTAVLQRPERRRPVPKTNVDHLTVVDGFLSSDAQPVFSGGFIWAPMEMDSAYFGLIGGEVWLPFGTLQSDGTLSDTTIEGIVNKLNALQAKGQKGSIGFGQNMASWAIRQWPDIDDYKGHFFSYDIDHPQVKGLWLDFIAALVPKARDHPAKFDYQLAVEPIWPSIGDWMVNNASPHTYQRYRSWLRERYGSIHALNSSWGTQYTGFSDITSRPSDNSNAALWYDWCRFNQWRVTDFFTFIRDAIHRYDPAAVCHIRISVGGINYIDAGERACTNLHSGIDREALTDLMEINGLDNFMQASSGRVSEQLRYYEEYDVDAYALRWLGHTILLDFIRSLGPDKLIYDSEWHSVSSVYYLNPEPPAGYMHTALWLSALHGLGATRTWYWSRNANGSINRFPEEFYGSLLVQPRLLNEYGIGLAELNTFGKEVVALERAPKQIRLLYSEPSAIQSVDYLHHQMITYEALHFTGLPVGFVTENDLKTSGLPASCRWLIVADASHVRQTTLSWLSQYVKGGGKLLVLGDNALKYNEYGRAHGSTQLDFMCHADKLAVTAPQVLLGHIEAQMARTGVRRHIRCVDTTSEQTAFGVMCRAVAYEGGYLVCLINLASGQKAVSIELNGNAVNTAVSLFENKAEKIRTVTLDPLSTRLFYISK